MRWENIYHYCKFYRSEIGYLLWESFRSIINFWIILQLGLFSQLQAMSSLLLPVSSDELSSIVPQIMGHSNVPRRCLYFIHDVYVYMRCCPILITNKAKSRRCELLKNICPGIPSAMSANTSWRDSLCRCYYFKKTDTDKSYPGGWCEDLKKKRIWWHLLLNDDPCKTQSHHDKGESIIKTWGTLSIHSVLKRQTCTYF